MESPTCSLSIDVSYILYIYIFINVKWKGKWSWLSIMGRFSIGRDDYQGLRKGIKVMGPHAGYRAFIPAT